MKSDILKRAVGIADVARKRLEDEHIGCFYGMDEPLLLISTAYPGVWLEHFYDAVFYATLDKSKLPLAENTARLFIKHQGKDGQLPCYILDEGRLTEKRAPIGFTQVQECVSFASLCLMLYRMNGDADFLREVYAASTRWVGWLKRNRMTTGRGLVEAFVGFDTGHDRSGRLQGLSCPGKYTVDGVPQNAATLPEGDEVAPMIAVDMNCNYFATLTALAEMAEELSHSDEARRWRSEAEEVKARLFARCLDREDCFFYDLDKNGRKRKYLSSTVFHLFMEGVLDGEEDGELIRELYAALSGEREISTTLKESLECHLMGISAEESRHGGGMTVKVHR